MSVFKTVLKSSSALLLTFSVSACVAAAPDSAPSDSAAQSTPAEIVGDVSVDLIAQDVLNLVQIVKETAGYPGVAISVRRGDQTIVEVGLGQADLEHGTPVSPDSVFQIGSLTKSFTSVLVAQLAVEGAIDLDAPISTYLPDYSGQAADVAVRHLMDHTAGLQNYTNLPTYFPGTRRAIEREDMTALFEDLPLMFEPGTAFSYSNSGTFLLGLIIESVSGQTYQDVLTVRILEPLGMNETQYGDWQTVIKNRVEGYVRQPDGYANAPILDPEIPFSAGAIVSTVKDIQTYIDQIHRQNIFGDEVRDILYTQTEFPDGDILDYAQGAIGIVDWEGRKKIAHAGDIDGFSAYMAYYPDDDVSIVVMTNTRDVAPSAVGLEQKIARIVFEAPRPGPSGLALTDAEIEALVGDYDAGRVRVGLPRIGIVASGDGVAAKFGGTDVEGPAIPLIHIEGRRFLAAHDDEMEFHFDPETGTAGDLTLQWLGGAIPFHRP